MKRYIRSGRYRRDCDISGELTPAYEHELADKIESIVLKYFETQGEPYYGATVIMYNSFKLDFPYTFTICADPPRSWHYPELFLKPGAAKNQFKSEIDTLLEQEGFTKSRFKIPNNQFLSISFER